MSETNAAERKRWNEETWVKAWPKREAMTDSVSPFLIDALALQPGERVLDVGSGGGKTTIAAARAVGPTGSAIGADLSAGLTDLATQRATEAGVENVSFCAVDVQQDTVPGAPFDVAMSQFGVMFFDEPLTAFTNLHAHLAPVGRLVFACWQSAERNPWFVGAALADFAAPIPPPAAGKSPTGPYALADRERTQGMLESAGFGNVRCTLHDLLPEVPDDALIDDAQLARMGVPQDKMNAALVAMTAHLEQFRSGPGLLKLPLAFQIFHATA
jgi:SAM-dependent methyltransferase